MWPFKKKKYKPDGSLWGLVAAVVNLTPTDHKRYTLKHRLAQVMWIDRIKEQPSKVWENMK